MATEENTTVKKKKGNFLTNLLFTQDDSDEETTEEVAEEKINVSNSGSQIVTTTSNIPVTAEGASDKNFADSLNQIILDNDIPGIDYVEFNKSIQQMKGAGLNESILFQTVFNTLKVSAPSLTKKSIQDAVDTYINLLKNEEKEFKAEMQTSIENEV